MMSQPWGIDGYAKPEAARTSSGRATPSPTQSGVYNSSAIRPALPSFWREGDDQVTSVRDDEPFEQRAVLPRQPLQPKRKLWQVALQLRGDELSRLWRRNAAHLAGRVFVWSDYTNQWVQLDGSSEFAHVQFAEPLPIASPRPALPIPKPTQRLGALARVQEIVDLTSLARPYLGNFPSRWAFGLAASLVTLVGLAALLPQRKTPNATNATQVVMPSPPHENARPTTSKPEPIPVGNLPLISGTQRSKLADTSMAARSQTADNPHHDSGSAVAAFNANAARQVLTRAARQAHHCASGDLSGSVLVTYEPSGAVGNVRINALAGDLSRSECIVNAFRTARIAPFAGSQLVVKKSF